MPKKTRSEISRHMHLFAKYPVSKEASQQFKAYQIALGYLYDLLDDYMPDSVAVIPKTLTQNDIERLREGYQKAMEAGAVFRKTAAAHADNASLTAQSELVGSMDDILADDFNALENVIQSEGKTFPEIIDEARSYRIDITGQTLSSTGANLSNRIPLKFEDRNGKIITGFFTETTVTDKNREINEAFNRAVEGHPEFERAFRGFMSSRSFIDDFEEPKCAKVYLGECLEKDDFKHAFDKYLLHLQPSKKNKDQAQINREKAELKSYIDSITANDTFARRMYAFIKDYSAIHNKYGVLEESGIADNGRNIDERNIAMNKIADLLGRPDLLARTVKMEVIDNGQVKKGVFMEFAEGSDLIHPTENDPLWRVDANGLNNPDSFKDTADLQVLDYICGNTDRHGGNMFYKFDETPNGPKITGVVGIDNDCSMGTLPPTTSNRYSRMVGTDSLVVISESMANKIMSMTPEMMEITLGDCHGLTPEEKNAAWERVNDLKKVIEKGVEFYDKNPDQKVQAGHLKVVKDDEWKTLNLRELAMPSQTKPEEEIDNLYGNYFSNLYLLPDIVKDAAADAQRKAAEEEKLWQKHPQLKGEKLPFVIADGIRLSERNTAGIADNNRNLNRLETEMERVNSGFFIGSPQFDNIITAFNTVKSLSEAAKPDMSANDLKRLHDEYEKLDKITKIYLEKKEKESRSKPLSKTAEERVKFAKELQQFTKERQTALSSEYVDLGNMMKEADIIMQRKNSSLNAVKGAVASIITCQVLHSFGDACEPDMFKATISDVTKLPGFQSFVNAENKEELQKGFISDMSATNQARQNQKILQGFNQHAALQVENDKKNDLSASERQAAADDSVKSFDMP